jgi:hypothetical protein
VLIAQDLMAWAKALLLEGDLARAEPKRLRYRLLHVAGRVTRSGRRVRLQLPRRWPWAADLLAAFSRLRALATPGSAARRSARSSGGTEIDSAWPRTGRRAWREAFASISWPFSATVNAAHGAIGPPTSCREVTPGACRTIRASARTCVHTAQRRPGSGHRATGYDCKPFPFDSAEEEPA